jgi:hypothetical protein
MPGYPIRTPWDHSSVDSSPRPIAASHVLHRLLVPRHPPYALTNLTTKIKRCSHPLCNSQQTTMRGAPPPTHPPRPHQQTTEGSGTGPPASLGTQRPGMRRACSFRTQQDASPPTTTGHHPGLPTPTGAVLPETVPPATGELRQRLRHRATPTRNKPVRARGAPDPHPR